MEKRYLGNSRYRNSKKGQALSMILLVVTIFVVGIILFFMNHLNKQVYDSFDEYFENDADLNNTEAHQTVETLQGVEGSTIWDYAFLAIFIGMMLQMILFSFASRTNVAFFWIFVILGMIILTIGTALSNMWQDISSNVEFSETILRFPITHTILGTYYPTIITGITFLGMIILFGKFPGQQE